ncbi:MAG TPA: hypothetical protein VM122_13640 [Usitatibacter sp.]|nr:hypothetical protein [Usitatibacter sp.]
MQKRLGILCLAFFAAAAAPADAVLLETEFHYNTTSYNDGQTRDTVALVTRRDDFGAERRPLILSMPGWGGDGDSGAIRDGYSNLYANNGYVVVNIGFHEAGGHFSSDVAESALAALNVICAQAFVDCSAVVLTGGSYGATQTHPVLRFLRANGVFDGSGGGNGGRRVVGILAQDAGYTLHYENPENADATAYSIAMIENQADLFFPIDGCDFGNCGARNRGDYHRGAAGSQYVLSYCPPGGAHGTHAGIWDAWVLSAVKTMMHNHRGVPKFTGYVEPSLAPTNACVTNAAGPAIVETSFNYNVTAYNDGQTRNTTALVTRLDNFGAERRPLILAMPGWDGNGNVAAARNAFTTTYANNGYVVVDIGFNQAGGYFSSDLAESAMAALNVVCGYAFVDCGAVVLTGGSYGGTQTHPVLRYLRANGTFDGSGGGNAGRRVVGILSQDAGYTLHYENPENADATAYSIAMIENQGDASFPIDGCDFGNCGARNRGNYHQAAAGSQYVLSHCPPGGAHGTHGAQWDTWVLSAMKTMLHNHRGVAKFTGYVEPAVAPTNACVTAAPAGLDLRITQSASPASGSTGKDLVFNVTVTNHDAGGATGVSLSDTLPAGSVFVWASPGCGNASGTVTCSIGTLPAGASATRKVVVRPGAAGVATNNASATASQGLLNNANALGVPVNASPVAALVQRYRLYSDVTKEHHFTTDQNEYNVLSGYVGTWVGEGTVGRILNNPGSYSGVAAVPYYRLYDNSTQWHHWTTDANEYYTLGGLSNWNSEGVDGYILPSAAAGTIQLFRLNYPFLGSLHHWTIDANEYNVLTTSYGWIGEGGAGYVVP